MTDCLLIDRADGIETWTLNRPDERNPVSSPDMIEALVAALGRADQDSDVRVVVLTGAGTAFSAGGNVKDMAGRHGMFAGSPAEVSNNYRRHIQRIPRAFDACEVPVVAAVNGPAIGAGCDLALMCDLRVASDNAFFAETFVDLGIIPGDGGAWFLPRLVGPSRAALMMLTGRRIPAPVALEWGLVDQVVPPDELLRAAHAIALEIAARPPSAVRLTKRLLRQAEAANLDTVLELSATLQSLSHHTQDHREALSAFSERRVGRYSGR